MPDPLRSGDYARKQIYCPNRVVAWSHGSRFRLATQLAQANGGGRLLDYGCGDGTFLALTHGMFPVAVGADIDEAQLAECRSRLEHLGGLRFLRTAELTNAVHHGCYDTVTCMEVLEHCPDAERLRVLDALRLLVAPRGQVIISVPIEIGPALPAKQLFRALAAWRGHGDYRHRETYSLGELVAATLSRTNLARARYQAASSTGTFEYCGHKGFDWRTLEAELRARFVVERRLFTPLPALGRFLNSQVWFVCHKT